MDGRTNSDALQDHEEWDQVSDNDIPALDNSQLKIVDRQQQTILKLIREKKEIQEQHASLLTAFQSEKEARRRAQFDIDHLKHLNLKQQVDLFTREQKLNELNYQKCSIEQDYKVEVQKHNGTLHALINTRELLANLSTPPHIKPHSESWLSFFSCCMRPTVQQDIEQPEDHVLIKRQ